MWRAICWIASSVRACRHSISERDWRSAGAGGPFAEGCKQVFLKGSIKLADRDKPANLCAKRADSRMGVHLLCL